MSEQIQPKGGQAAEEKELNEVLKVRREKLAALRAEGEDAPEPWRYVTPEEMNALALPTAVKRAAEIAREKLGQQKTEN